MLPTVMCQESETPPSDASFDHLYDLLVRVVVDNSGEGVSFDEGAAQMKALVEDAHERGQATHFIGNGGSAAIAAHMAADYAKNGLRAQCFSNLSAITAISNDDGYGEVFSQQIAMHGREGDVLVAISSSGRSPNIVRAVEVALRRGMFVITFSGMDPENPLRAKGSLNFYLPSHTYGLLEVGHHCLCHLILMRSMECRGLSTRGGAAALAHGR